MAKILRELSLLHLRARRAGLIRQLRIPHIAIRASYVSQLLTCGKPNCRCNRGHKHGPFYYLVRSQTNGRIEKFLLKTTAQRATARASIAAFARFQKQLNYLSDLNAELLRRGERLLD